MITMRRITIRIIIVIMIILVIIVIITRITVIIIIIIIIMTITITTIYDNNNNNENNDKATPINHQVRFAHTHEPPRSHSSSHQIRLAPWLRMKTGSNKRLKLRKLLGNHHAFKIRLKTHHMYGYI